MRLSAVLAAAALAGSADAAAIRGGSVSSTRNVTSGGCQGSSYDFFLLTTQWDITECMDVFSCSSSNQFFTMHGLWPNNEDGSYPCDCTDEPFDPSKISSISSQMNTYWPSLNGPSSSFWSHEWSKHGTCAEDVTPTQLAYFSTALHLRSQYDVVAALTQAGFPPSDNNGFTLSQFKNAILTAYNAGASVTCDSQGNIESVSQCISKNLTAIKCPSSVSDSCSASTLYLPSSMSAASLQKRLAEKQAKAEAAGALRKPAEHAPVKMVPAAATQ